MNKWAPGLLIFGGMLMMASLPAALAIAVNFTISSMDPCTCIALICCVVGFFAGVAMVGRGAILATRKPKEKAPDD